MNPVFLTSALGWLASIFLLCECFLPYLLRRSALSRWLGTVPDAQSKPYLSRMWPHYWIGYALFPLALAHAWLPMSVGGARGVNPIGLWLASAALLLLPIQPVLGLALKRTGLEGRGQVRRAHYWLMVVLAASVVAHICLNG